MNRIPFPRYGILCSAQIASISGIFAPSYQFRVIPGAAHSFAEWNVYSTRSHSGHAHLFTAGPCVLTVFAFRSESVRIGRFM